MQGSPFSGRANNILLVVLIAVLGIGWSYLMFGQSQMPIPKQAYLEEIEQRLTKHQETIKTEAAAVAMEVIPPISQAIYEETRQDLPRYVEEIQDQGGLFTDHVQDLFIGKAQDQYRSYLRLHRQVLAEEFPNYADAESLDQITAEFERMLNRLVERYYLNEFENQIQVSEMYWARINPIPKADNGQLDLNQQLTDYIADWSVLAFSEQAETKIGID